MFKSNKFICLIFLLLMKFSSNAISAESWSRNDWFVFYGSLDSLEHFLEIEKFENFKGLLSNGWNTYSWYDSKLEDKRWGDSVIIDKANNRVKFYGHDFDEYGESGDSYDSIYLVFDNNGLLKEKIKFQEYKDFYSVNSQTVKIDTIVRQLWDSTNLQWENKSKSVFEYQKSKCVREEAFYWNDGHGWDDHYIRRYIYGSSGKLDSSFYTVEGASEILVYSYSNNDKTVTAEKYEQWNPGDPLLVLGKEVIHLNSLGKDSVISEYGSSMQISKEKVIQYSSLGNIEMIVMKRVRSGSDTLQNYWKNEFYYNNQNQPIGFNFFIYYQDKWVIEDLNTTSYSFQTSNFSNHTNRFSISSSAKVIQNHNNYSISFQLNNHDIKVAKLLDMQGRVIKSIVPTLKGDRVAYEFDTKNVAKGKVYLFSLSSSIVKYTKSIIVD